MSSPYIPSSFYKLTLSPFKKIKLSYPSPRNTKPQKRKKGITPLGDYEGNVDNVNMKNTFINATNNQNQIDPEALMVMNSRKRAAQWAADMNEDESMVGAIREGIYGKVSVHTHKFRDQDKNKHLSNNNMLSRRYLPAKERARLEQLKHKSEQLDRGTNNNHPPY